MDLKKAKNVGIFMVLGILWGSWADAGPVPRGTPKALKNLSDQFDDACHNLLIGKTDQSAEAVEKTLKLLEEEGNQSQGRAKKMMGNAVREMRRLQRDIRRNTLASRKHRLESLYADAEAALKGHLKKTDPSAAIPKETIIGNAGLCLLNDGE